MKKHIYLFSVIFLLSTILMAAPAKASTITVTTPIVNTSNSLLDGILGLLGLEGTTNTGGSTTPAGGSGTHLPINNGMIFLLLGGVAIGLTTINKNKLTKLA